MSTESQYSNKQQPKERDFDLNDANAPDDRLQTDVANGAQTPVAGESTPLEEVVTETGATENSVAGESLEELERQLFSAIEEDQHTAVSKDTDPLKESSPIATADELPSEDSNSGDSIETVADTTVQTTDAVNDDVGSVKSSTDEASENKQEALDEQESFEDTELYRDDFSLTVAQEEAVVNWEIKGFYDEQGKVRSKRSLRNNPPALVITDSTGNSASFILTKNVASTFALRLDNVYRAYYGVKPKDELTLKDKLQEAKGEAKKNMGKLIIVGGLLTALLIFGIFF